jgi:hypothetical protein
VCWIQVASYLQRKSEWLIRCANFDISSHTKNHSHAILFCDYWLKDRRFIHLFWRKRFFEWFLAQKNYFTSPNCLWLYKCKKDNDETPSSNGVVWAYFLCYWVSKSSCLLVFRVFGKKKIARPCLWAPADRPPLWFFWLIISSRTIHSYVTTSVNDFLSCFSKWK